MNCPSPISFNFFTSLRVFWYLGWMITVFMGRPAQGQSVFSTGEDFAGTHFKLGRYGQYMLQKEYQLWTQDPVQRKAMAEELSIIVPHIRKKLAGQNVPMDFLYLSIYPFWQPDSFHIELLPAHIHWVLTQDKAKELRVHQTEQIDLRKHILHATDAGIKSIQRDHILYRHWPGALWAQLASQRIFSAQVANWKKTDTLLLDQPSQYALFKFLAFKKLMERELQKWADRETYVLYEFPFGSGMPLPQVAQELSVSPAHLETFNAWRLSAQSQEPLLVPLPMSRYQQTKAFVEFLHLHEEEISDPNRLAYPIITEGLKPKKAKGGVYFKLNGKLGIQAHLHDSFVDLAYLSGVSLKDILRNNDLTEIDTPRVGTIYYLEEKDTKGPVDFHILKPYETLWDVAHRYGIQVKTLLEFNLLRQSALALTGQKLWLKRKRPSRTEVEIVDLDIPEPLLQPEKVYHEPVLQLPIDTEWPTEEIVEEELPPLPKRPAERVIPQPEPVYHVVKKGETVFRLSVMYQVTIDQIKTWNQLKDNTIYEGTRMIVGQK